MCAPAACFYPLTPSTCQPRMQDLDGLPHPLHADRKEEERLLPEEGSLQEGSQEEGSQPLVEPLVEATRPSADRCRPSCCWRLTWPLVVASIRQGADR